METPVINTVLEVDKVGLNGVSQEEARPVPQRDTSRWARAAWTALADPGDVTAGNLVEFFGALEALERLMRLATHEVEPDEDTIRDTFKPFVLPASVAKIAGWALRWRAVSVDQELEWLWENDGSFLIPGDPQWPRTLDTMGANRPLALWVRGNPAAVQDTETGAVALVGSRSATRYGMSMAGELGYDLAQHGVWVISGGAYGIDAAGHRGALGSSGKTLCVQAGGLRELYPAMNTSMFDQILETGAIISEQPWSYRPQRHLFLSRNRLISALSQVVVVVEAGTRSGAMSTANHGAEQGRTVAAVPGLVTSGASAGCHQLIREGATLVTCAGEVLELMQPFVAPDENPIGARSTAGSLGEGAGHSAENVTLSTAAAKESSEAGHSAPTAGSNANPSTKPSADSLFSPFLKPETIKVFDALPKRMWGSPENIAQKAGLGISATLGELGLLVLDGKAETRDGKYRRPQP
ncbi:DNA-processing protein DprA [Mobiluncus mulieris]|uniref:DNA-processing protein DprA n=1 Tax=Mobiluncus mulieris TaxID=2052 RepID=UPI001B8B0E3C|nr:DNA-processing protein DprA [Mobiluncus mulieris]